MTRNLKLNSKKFRLTDVSIGDCVGYLITDEKGYSMLFSNQISLEIKEALKRKVNDKELKDLLMKNLFFPHWLKSRT